MKEKEKFEVKDLSSATWALRKISEIQRKIYEVEELAKQETHRIDTWKEKETESKKNSIQYFERLLQQYYAEERKKDPKFKLSTPYGRVSSRRLQHKYEFDEKQTLEYLKENQPELVKIEEKFNKTDAKKIFQPVQVDNEIKVVDGNGSLVDFVKVTPQGEKITVKAE